MAKQFKIILPFEVTTLPRRESFHTKQNPMWKIYVYEPHKHRILLKSFIEPAIKLKQSAFWSLSCWKLPITLFHGAFQW